MFLEGVVARLRLGFRTYTYLLITGIFCILASPLVTRAAETVYPPLKLNVPISGSELGAPVVRDGYLYVTFLAEYIQTAYDYLIGISMIAAAIMIVYGGFKYIVSSSGAGVQTGKEVIKDAIIGLLLVLGSYTILATVNPKLMVLDQLKVQVIRPSPDQSYIDEFGSTPNDPALYEKAARPQPIAPGPALDVSDIGFDKLKTGAAKITAINRKGRDLFKAATTYQERMDALAKVVVGYKTVCVDQGQCAYCQSCSTGDERATSVDCAAHYVLQKPEILGRLRQVTSDMTCDDIIGNPNASKNPDYENLKGKCGLYAREVYRRIFGAALMASGQWAGNCSSFSMGAFNQGLGFNLSKVLYDKGNYPTNSLADPKGRFFKVKKGEMATFDVEGWEAAMREYPTTFYVGNMSDFSMQIAGKGGLKFGDLLFIQKSPKAGGGAQHWFLYTGGRPDVHFNFLEMGAGTANVPGWGEVGGVKAWQQGSTIEDYLDRLLLGEILWSCRKTNPPKNCYDKNGKIIRDKPKIAPEDGILVVYRPILENAGSIAP
ncbi:MAG: pilin [Patescibacteria group bacterium]